MRVLVVEDDARIAGDVAAALAAAGYAVEREANGEEAWFAAIRRISTRWCSISACPPWMASPS